MIDKIKKQFNSIDSSMEYEFINLSDSSILIIIHTHHSIIINIYDNKILINVREEKRNINLYNIDDDDLPKEVVDIIKKEI